MWQSRETLLFYRRVLYNMASPRYTLDMVIEEEEKKEYTKKEKRANFWHYHKWHIFGSLAGIALITMFAIEILTVEEPDMSVAFVCDVIIDSNALVTLENALEEKVIDANGDGEVVVYVNQYNVASANSESSATADPYIQMAAVTKLSADLQLGESVLFFTDDIETFQTAYGVLAYNDGTSPVEGEAVDYDNLGIKWSDSEMLTSLELGEFVDVGGNTHDAQDVFDDFYVATRAFEGTAIEGDEEKAEYYDMCMELYAEILN